MNRIYLDILMGARSPAASWIATGVAALRPEHRQAFARTPFSLFDARFSEGTFWSHLIHAVHEPTCYLDGTGHTHGFNQWVLFYAWHLARSDAMAARLLLGMSPRTQEIFKQLSLPHLQQLAASEPKLIQPRWSDRTTVWQIMLGAARLGPAHLADVRMFGIQLIAGDLAEASEV